MARPVVRSLDRFPTKTKLLYDTRIKALRRSFKDEGNANNAFFVFDHLFREIFGNEGYYIRFDDNLVGDVADFCYVTENFVLDVIQKCIELDLFDKEQFERNEILTSRAIQNKYQDIFAAMKRTAEIEGRFCVLGRIVSSENSGVSSEETPEKLEETPRKKERKEINKEREESVFSKKVFDSDSEFPDADAPGVVEDADDGAVDAAAVDADEDDGGKLDPFEELKFWWNRKRKTSKVKMSEITQLIASPVIASRLMQRIEEFGEEAIQIAIDRIDDATWWQMEGKTLGVETFLKDDIFPKFLNREYGMSEPKKR